MSASFVVLSVDICVALEIAICNLCCNRYCLNEEQLISGSSYVTFRGMLILYVDNRKLVNCFVTVMENRIAGRLGETCEISLAIT